MGLEDGEAGAWGAGACFRHPQAGLQETRLITVLTTRDGMAVEVRACRPCCQQLWAARRGESGE